MSLPHTPTLYVCTPYQRDKIYREGSFTLAFQAHALSIGKRPEEVEVSWMEGDPEGDRGGETLRLLVLPGAIPGTGRKAIPEDHFLCVPLVGVFAGGYTLVEFNPEKGSGYGYGSSFSPMADWLRIKADRAFQTLCQTVQSLGFEDPTFSLLIT